MGQVIYMDSLRSLVSGMGDPYRDKSATAFYDIPLSNDADLLNAYRGAWLPRKIVDIPAMDAVRKWRDWQADADQIEKIEAEEVRLGVRRKVLDAKTKARLFGGAAIYIGTGDPDPLAPLMPEKIGLAGVKYLTVIARQRLTAGELDPDPMSEFYGQPLYYEIAGSDGVTVRVHPSRIVRFMGAPHPDEWMNTGTNSGWGDSALTAVFDAIKHADSTAANIASLVFEANVDVIGMPDFMASLSDPAYRRAVLERTQLAATAKGINRALVLDKEDTYERKQVSFATLPDVMQSFLQIVSGAADIPVTRLLGQSPAGLSSTGESDLRNYYDRISAMQELEIGPSMRTLDECLIRSALGTRPPEIHYIWSSLWQISDKERADIGKINAETIKTLNDTALFPPEALAKAGANMLVENSILPGFEQEIDDAGGLPDYEMEAEKEAEAERVRLEATAKGKGGDDPLPSR